MSRERLVYGFHAVAARLRQDPAGVREVYVVHSRDDARSRDIAALAAERGVRVVPVPAERLDGMLPGVRHQGVACTAQPRAAIHDIEDVLDAVQGHPLVLVLDGVTDPHNLGACLRSADAMGVHAVMAPKDRAVGLTPVVEKVASGAAETVPYVMVTNLARSLDTLKDRGLFVVGLAGEADGPLHAQALDGPVALVMGAEGAGMRRLTRERCDVLAAIPMSGTVESLNVSVAAGICLYEARRQRLTAAR
jgi:23S rRNA (guanosine2251-2'-O)-methyltransferase